MTSFDRNESTIRMDCCFAMQRLMSHAWLFLGLLAALPGFAQSVVYDNLDRVRPGNPRFFGENGDLVAQQFLLGEDTRLSSVAVNMLGVGSPIGPIDLELWSDSGFGTPKDRIATIGSLDERAPFPLQKITFDTQIGGLEAGGAYFIVLSFFDAAFANQSNGVEWSMVGSDSGTFDAAQALFLGEFFELEPAPEQWTPIADLVVGAPFEGQANYFAMQVTTRPDTTMTSLRAGDADQDLDFDQLDLVQVQIAAKYLTGQAATWGDGDWDAAPGGHVGSPPPGDGMFNQLDIITALRAGTYLTGPYASVQPDGQQIDGPASLVYNASTGEVAIDTPANSLEATIDSVFDSVSFGNIAQVGSTEDFLLGDQIVAGSLSGRDPNAVDPIQVPEPSCVVSLVLGTLTLIVCCRHVDCGIG